MTRFRFDDWNNDATLLMVMDLPQRRMMIMSDDNLHATIAAQAAEIERLHKINKALGHIAEVVWDAFCEKYDVDDIVILNALKDAEMVECRTATEDDIDYNEDIEAGDNYYVLNKFGRDALHGRR